MKARRTAPAMKPPAMGKRGLPQQFGAFMARLGWKRAGYIGIYIIEPRLAQRLIYGNDTLTRCRIGVTSARPTRNSDAPRIQSNAQQWMLGFPAAKPIVIWVRNKPSYQAIMKRLAKSLGDDEQEILASWYPKTAAQMRDLIGLAAATADVETMTTAEIRAEQAADQQRGSLKRRG